MENVVKLLFSVIIFTTCKSNGTDSSEISSPTQTGSGQANTGLNLSGCPRLQSNCNFDCLSVGSNGCITCTCKVSGSAGASALTGGTTFISSSIGQLGSQLSLNNSNQQTGGVLHPQGSGSTGMGTVLGVNSNLSDNNNGCPSFPVNCLPECAQLNKAGCPICTCSTGGRSNSSSTQQGSNAASSVTSQNLNGCPAFSRGCTADCLGLDTNGCPTCSCPSIDGSSSSTDNHMTSGASANANGCPLFMPTCRQDCVTLDGHGCPICFCDKSKGSTTGVGTNNTSGYGHASMTGSVGNNNGCPVFPTNCRADCATLSVNGCPMCLCTASTLLPSMKQPTPSSEIPKTTASTSTNPAGPDITGNANNCPPFDVNCKPGCAVIDSQGCLSCSCGQETTRQPSGLETLSPLLTRTTFAPLIPGIGTDTSGVNKTAGIGSGCPSFESSCAQSCTHIDSMGCLTCTCQGSKSNSTSSKDNTAQGNNNGCPLFDITCPSGCASIDAIGCLTCTCSVTTISNSSTSPKPTEQSPVTMTAILVTSASTTPTITLPTRPTATKSSSMTARCPKFDVSCSSSCTRLDRRSCLVCTCTEPFTITARVTRSTIMTSIPYSQPTTIPKLHPHVCRPIRCVYPCDAGVLLAVDNCPVCQCRTTTISPKP